MSRNQKYQPAAVRFGPAIKAVLLCALFAGAGLGYVWQKAQIQHLAEQKKRSESRYDELRRQNIILTGTVAGLCSQRALDLQVKTMKLGLARPPLDQIVRLSEEAEAGVPAEPQGGPRIHETMQLYASRR